SCSPSRRLQVRFLPRLPSTEILGPFLKAEAHNRWRMPKAPSQIRTEGIARFRLWRHHLLDDPPQDAVTICRDMCGVQAQVMSAAYLQLWTRNHAITRA